MSEEGDSRTRTSNARTGDAGFDDTVPATPGGGVLTPGEVVGDYEVVDVIGQGGMGAVYLALDRTLHRPVALKVIQPERLGSAEAVVSFIDEARITARVAHPHVVTVYGVGEYRGAPYVALEYVEGPSLAEVLEDPAAEMPDAVRVVAEVAEAIAEAHRHGVIHRDLKPANIIMPREGPLRVVDFGIAKRLTGEAPPSARSALLLGREYTHAGSGTPSYMAPEQWTGDRCSEATDTWALGVILYHLLSGELPYDEGSFEAQRDRVTSAEAAPALPEVVADDGLRELVAACLAKRPGERPAASEVARRLRAMMAPATPATGRLPLLAAIGCALVLGVVAIRHEMAPAPLTADAGLAEAGARLEPAIPVYDPQAAKEALHALARQAAGECQGEKGPPSLFVQLTIDPGGSPAIVLTEEDGPREDCVRRVFRELRLTAWHGPPMKVGQLVRFGAER